MFDAYLSGFESHYPPHKKNTILPDGVLFMEWIRDSKGRRQFYCRKNSPVDCF
nr:MAG TPA: hypothetical protein [Caudoviricetes sp.]